MLTDKLISDDGISDPNWHRCCAGAWQLIMLSGSLPTFFDDVRTSLPCGYDAWVQIWGDPIFSGTVLMICYGVTGAAVYAVSKRSEARERLLWRLCAAILFLLLLNTHLDLQAFVWSFGKCLARTQGWYENRHGVQSAAVIAVLIAVPAITALVLFYFRRNLLRNVLLLLGVMIVLGVTITKAIDHDGLGYYYGVDFGYLAGKDVIELVGIAIAFCAVAVRRRQLRRQRQQM